MTSAAIRPGRYSVRVAGAEQRQLQPVAGHKRVAVARAGLELREEQRADHGDADRLAELLHGARDA